MKFTKTVIWICYILLLAACGGASATPYPPPLFLSSRPASGNHSYVNVSIDEIKILSDTQDPIGMGEFRLLIIGADTEGRSSGMYCPGNEPIKINQGDTIKSPCLFVTSFDENTVGDGVFLMVIVVDEDESSLPADLTYELVTNQLGTALGKVVSKKLVSVAAKSNPYTLATSVLVSYLGGKVKDWVEKADTIGAQGIFLSRDDNWSAGEQTEAISNDGGIQIIYTVSKSNATLPANTKTSSASPHPSSPTKTQSPLLVEPTTVQSSPQLTSVRASQPTTGELNTLQSIWDANNIINLDLEAPGKKGYSVTVRPTDKFLWAYYWCASTEEVLSNNLKYLTVDFLIDNAKVSDSLIVTYADASSEWKCKNWETTLSDWKSGEVIRLDIRYRFTKDVFDGYKTYPSGEYIYGLTASVK